MECPRCTGLMVSERHVTDEYVTTQWRCANCGNVLDDRVLENKKAHEVVNQPRDRVNPIPLPVRWRLVGVAKAFCLLCHRATMHHVVEVEEQPDTVCTMCGASCSSRFGSVGRIYQSHKYCGSACEEKKKMVFREEPYG